MAGKCSRNAGSQGNVELAKCTRYPQVPMLPLATPYCFDYPSVYAVPPPCTTACCATDGITMVCILSIATVTCKCVPSVAIWHVPY